jgi:hypothetical protein
MHASEKKKILGAGCYGIAMPDSIQPGEYSKGGGMDDIRRSSDGDPNLLGVNRNGDGRWLNAYYDRPDDRWNRDNGFAFAVSQLSLFLSCFRGRVLFSELSAPAAKHTANLIQFYRQGDIFFIIKGFGFPENQKQNPKSIHFSDCQPYVGLFFSPRTKAGGRYCFDYINK